MEADRLIGQFEKQAANVRRVIRQGMSDDKLTNRIWGPESVLWYDRQCKCNFRTTPAGLPVSNFMCVACQSFINLSNLKEDVIQTLTIERDDGECEIRVQRIPDIVPHILPSNRAAICGTHVISHYPKFAYLRETLAPENTLECDPFTASLLLGWALNEFTHAREYPNVHTYGGFICGRTGYLVKEQTLSLEELTESVRESLEEKEYYPADELRAILFSILLHLQLFEEHHITMSRPCLSIIRAKAEPSEFKWNGKKFNFSVTILLDPPLLSSGELNLSPELRVRLGNKTAYSDRVLENMSVFPHLSVELLPLPGCKENCPVNDILCYRTTNEDSEFFITLRAVGVPLLGSAFDTTCLLFSLMSYKPFALSFNKEKNMAIFWDSVWHPSDLPIVNERTRSYHDKRSPTFEQISKDIMGLRIRCDLLELLCEQMKKQAK